MTEKEQGTIYLNTAQYSVEHDEIEQYRISHRQSEECREAIDKAISENFDGMRLKDGFIPELIDKFGMERVQYILATTIRENLGDGRYSRRQIQPRKQGLGREYSSVRKSGRAEELLFAIASCRH